MSRPVQAGDLVTVTVDNFDYLFPIVSVDGNKIRIQDNDIIRVDDKWLIANYNVPHTVTFKKNDNMPITSKDLINRCDAGEPDIVRMCEEEQFWEIRMKKDFGNISQDRIPGYTHKSQYRRLAKLDELGIPRDNFIADIIKADRVDVLKNISKAGYKFYPVDAENAVKYGRIPALALFKDLGITSYSIDPAVSSNNLELVKWAFANGIAPKVSDDAYYKAAVGDYTQMLDLLWKNGLQIGSVPIAEALAHGADGELMTWIVQKGIPLPAALPDRLLSTQTNSLNLDALNWLWNKGVRPSSEAITQLLKGADPKIRWLLSKYTLQ